MLWNIPFSLQDFKQIILAVDFFLIVFSGDLINIGDGYQIKADLVRGFKVIPNVSTTLVLEYHDYNEPSCYDLLYDEICTAISYNKKARTCLKNLYGRVFLEPDPDSETYLKSVIP